MVPRTPRFIRHDTRVPYTPLVRSVGGEGNPRVQATIAFGDDETIENVAIGDSQAGQVTPNKLANLLFVKPLAANAVTNMTVVTSRRTYLFVLVASQRGNPVYLLRFTYPEPPPGATEARLAGAEGDRKCVV